MTNLEKLEKETADNNVDIVSYPFKSNRIKGLYCDGTVALNKSIQTSNERRCVLAEELGHHYTSSGDIIDLSLTDNRKQEYRARLWSYNKLIGLHGIISAYKAGCQNAHNMAEHLDVTEEFLNEALNCYRQKYGVYTTLDNYIIYFEPSIGVFKLI